MTTDWLLLIVNFSSNLKLIAYTSKTAMQASKIVQMLSIDNWSYVNAIHTIMKCLTVYAISQDFQLQIYILIYYLLT